MKQFICVFSVLVMLAAFMGGCAAQPASSAATPAGPETSKQAILVVSFGTSYPETREATIGAVEKAIAAACPDWQVRRAFTSQIIIEKLKSRDGLEIDTVEQALERLLADGVKTLVVQPTHVMNGHEYDEMIAAVAPYAAQFEKLAYGEPLLAAQDDYTLLAQALRIQTADYDVDGAAVVWMGHGTDHAANDAYQKLWDVFAAQDGPAAYIVGTVEATPTLEDVMAAVESSGAKRVVLLPLMIVAGDHASNDMAGDEAGSWKTEFLSQGYEVDCVLRGMGEYEAVQQLFVRHCGDAIARLG